MKQFQGFPARMEFTPIPNVFFSGVLPQIDDVTELKVTLYMLAALYRKKGYPRFIGFSEIAGDASLIHSLKCGEEASEELLRGALKAASKRGVFLRLTLDRDGAAEDVYFLNDESGRQAVAKIDSGELKLSGLKARAPAAAAEEMPDIFTLYEQNIGMLTPLIADELRDAEKNYPPEWIRDAIKEAVLNNKRNIRYIMRILENWSIEGRSDGTYRRDTKKAGPDKYFKGKYGHMVQR